MTQVFQTTLLRFLTPVLSGSSSEGKFLSLSAPLAANGTSIADMSPGRKKNLRRIYSETMNSRKEKNNSSSGGIYK
jgi:hypothetical protein